MDCPRCDVAMKCDCGACRSNPKATVLPGVYQVSDNRTDIIRCGNCGQAAHIDEWEELAARLLFGPQGEEGAA